LTTAAPRPRTDRETEARFQRGDREAFLLVYAAHAPVLRALVGRYFTKAFEREEAVQEVWLLVHRMTASFEPERGPLLAWLRVLAANRCKELLRAKGRRPDPKVDLEDDALISVEDPEKQVRAARLQQAVGAFMATLEEDEARVFQLSLLEERTHDETAASTGMSARRCKYLRMKLLLRASVSPTLRAAFGESGDA